MRDTTKQGAAFLHHGVLTAGQLAVGASVSAQVEPGIRQATALNHSATHLLHAAMRGVLGEHVEQKGSLVESSRLRFDFSHFEAVSREQLREIEQIVNAQIRANSAVGVEVTDMETARARGAMALFGEKYGDEVRVLTMGGDFSVELCGGTHVGRTGDIGLFRVTAESGISAGVRRIEAVTGAGALALFDEVDARNAQLARLLRSGRDEVVSKVEALVAANRTLEKEVERLRAKLASGGGGTDLGAAAVDVGGLKVLAAQLEGADAKSLRAAVDQWKQKLGDAVVLFASVEEGKVSLVAGVSGAAAAQLKAGDLVADIAARIGGKGGGRADMAQGGGTDAAALPAALEALAGLVRGKLGL